MCFQSLIQLTRLCHGAPLLMSHMLHCNDQSFSLQIKHPIIFLINLFNKCLKMAGKKSCHNFLLPNLQSVSFELRSKYVKFTMQNKEKQQILMLKLENSLVFFQKKEKDKLQIFCH